MMNRREHRSALNLLEKARNIFARRKAGRARAK